MRKVWVRDPFRRKDKRQEPLNAYSMEGMMLLCNADSLMTVKWKGLAIRQESLRWRKRFGELSECASEQVGKGRSELTFLVNSTTQSAVLTSCLETERSKTRKMRYPRTLHLWNTHYWGILRLHRITKSVISRYLVRGRRESSWFRWHNEFHWRRIEGDTPERWPRILKQLMHAQGPNASRRISWLQIWENA